MTQDTTIFQSQFVLFFVMNMKKILLLISWPPGVGKLTISNWIKQEFSEFFILHNHITLDFARKFFELNTKQLSEIHNKTRMLIIEKMIEIENSIIITMCYTKNKQEKNIKKIMNLAYKFWYEIKYIHLTADFDNLKCRINDESRKKYWKLRDFDNLKRFIETSEVWDKIPFLNWIQIDSSNLTINQTLQKVKRFIES